MAAPEEMDQTWSAFFDLVTVEGHSSWPQHHGQGCSVLPSPKLMSGFISVSPILGDWEARTPGPVAPVPRSFSY